jgi:hypothetical protein
MQSGHKGWVMPEEDIASMLQLIEERIASSEIEVRHRDTLIRFRSMLADDLLQIRKAAPARPGSSASGRTGVSDSR